MMESNMAKRRIIIAVIATIVICVICGMTLIYGSPSRKLRKQIELGEKYLSELNYEQAIAVFKEALNIDPSNQESILGITKAYSDWSSGLAAQQDYETAVAKLDEARYLLPDSQTIAEREVDIYLEWASYHESFGDLEKAISILQEGYSKLGDARLQHKIDEYTEVLEQAARDEEITEQQDIQSDDEAEVQFRLVEGYYKAPSITLRENISYDGENIVDSTANTRYVFEPTDKINEYRNYDREGLVAIIILTGDDKYTYQLRELESNASVLEFHYKYFGQTVWG